MNYKNKQMQWMRQVICKDSDEEERERMVVTSDGGGGGGSRIIR